ncbi:hypothetical protein ACFL0V_02605 [Nanoarchaeota archaeon]
MVEELQRLGYLSLHHLRAAVNNPTGRTMDEAGSFFRLFGRELCEIADVTPATLPERVEGDELEKYFLQYAVGGVPADLLPRVVREHPLRPDSPDVRLGIGFYVESGWPYDNIRREAISQALTGNYGEILRVLEGLGGSER